MAIYVSPLGNPEVWAEKPAGYFTTEHWAEMHPTPQPEPPTRAEVVEEKLAEVMVGYTAAFAPVQAMYPSLEREGWPIQLEEARAVLADPEADALTLALMVEMRGMGESVADFAHTVIANNSYYRSFYAALTGQQQRMFRDVRSMAATEGVTAAEVLAYPVEYRMPEGLDHGV